MSELDVGGDTASVDADSGDTLGAPGRHLIAPSALGRLYRGQTAVNFYGRRRWGYWLSAALLLLSVVSLFTRGLNLGIDFTGGVSWDVPADNVSADDARDILSDNGVPSNNAKIQTRSSESGDVLRIQVADQDASVREAVRADLAAKAGVELQDVSVSSVSSSWGRDITEKAVRALVIFLLLVGLFISIRFEWRMAAAAIVAMIHDVLLSVGIYSMFGFEVTPATVIAFLTILGYSLYDTIVVFDRVRENEGRYVTSRLSYPDIINISMNQVFMRSLNTSVSAMLPVVALLVIGAGLLGAVTLSEFALALLVGMITGAYSSIFIATPLLAAFRSHGKGRLAPGDEVLVGDDLRRIVIGGSPATRRRSSRRASATQAAIEDGSEAASSGHPAPITDASPTELLTHAPRPRKKKRR